MPPAKSSASSRGPAWFFALFLIAVVIFAYRPAWNGGFVWDDDLYVTKNPLLVAPDGLQKIWFSLESPSQYFPLTYTTLRIERALWGLRPTGYHWTNILLHAANALLLWWLLTRLKIPGAWLAAGIFALHPVQVESVAWITERKNVLMGFFFLLTLLTWTKFLDKQTKQRGRFYALALVFYLLALSAKSTACTLPAALFLILWLQEKRIDSRRLLQIVPFLALGLAVGLVAVWWERYHQFTRGALFALGPLERLLVASHAVWFYLAKLFWPIKLTFIYPSWTIAPNNPLSYGWVVAGVALCAAIYSARRYVGRSVEVAAVFFVATLSPVVGFIMLYTFRYTFVADHYQYLASIGPIALVAAGLATLAKSLRLNAPSLQGVGAALFATLGILTWRQSASYSDIETLWRTTLMKNPGCWMAENNLGKALFEKGRRDEAITHYRRSLQLEPQFPQTHYNLSNALVQAGALDEGIAEAQQALELQPNDADTHVVMGIALFMKQRPEEAIAHYLKALELRPKDSMVHYNLAMVLTERRQFAEAIAHYEQAIEEQPNLQEALVNMAWLLATSPEPALRNGPRAIELAEKANRLTSGRNALVLRVLAAAYAERGFFAKAVETAQRASEVADQEGKFDLVGALRREIALYQSGSVYRGP